MFIETTITNLQEICSKSPVIPVVTIENPDQAVDIANALIAGGVHIIEITLRTPNALDAIANIKQSKCNITIGAGTILNDTQPYKARKAGADFGVTPGTTASILDAGYDSTLPILPGVSTISEMMQWRAYGLNFFKFFPAVASGGIDFLKSAYDPFPDIAFCPTGGIRPDTARSFLDLPNVVCVGGSWITKAETLKNNRYDQITQLAQATRTL